MLSPRATRTISTNRHSALAAIAIFTVEDAKLSEANNANLPASRPCGLAAQRQDHHRAKRPLYRSDRRPIRSCSCPMMEGTGDKARRIGTAGLAWSTAPLEAQLQHQLLQAVLIARGRHDRAARGHPVGHPRHRQQAAGQGRQPQSAPRTRSSMSRWKVGQHHPACRRNRRYRAGPHRLPSGR